jgi:hypothetical protein
VHHELNATNVRLRDAARVRLRDAATARLRAAMAAMRLSMSAVVITVQMAPTPAHLT